MTDKKVMQQALAVLNRSSPNTTADYEWKPNGWVEQRLAVIAALETAIAQPEQPVQPDPTNAQLAAYLRDRACGGSNYNRALNHAASVLTGGIP